MIWVTYLWAKDVHQQASRGRGTEQEEDGNRSKPANGGKVSIFEVQSMVVLVGSVHLFKYPERVHEANGAKEAGGRADDDQPVMETVRCQFAASKGQGINVSRDDDKTKVDNETYLDWPLAPTVAAIATV